MNCDKKYIPSIMGAKPWDMLTYVRKFEENGIKLIHFDIMDGNYVPNIMLSSETYASFHEETDIQLDLHLMVANPTKAVEYFKVLPGDYVSFHPDACEDLDEVCELLRTIKNKGAKAGIAISPQISTDWIDNTKELLDFVLIMSVQPGFSGQKFIPEVLEKVTYAHNVACSLANLDEINSSTNSAKDNTTTTNSTSSTSTTQPAFEVFADGNCEPENAQKVFAAGGDGVVICSALFNKNNKAENFNKDFKKYKEAICLE